MSNDEMIDVENDRVLDYLNELLDKPVILAWPRGVKGAPRKWKDITYDTIQWKEIEQAIRRGGNLGIVLGPLSNNLVTLDLDSDEEMDRFFKFAPWAKNTLRTRGGHGCQCWFYIEGWYPPSRTVWKNGVDGNPVVEFRTGVQSIFWGDHPDKDGKVDGRYTCNIRKPLRISYYELDEYRRYLSEQGEEVKGDWRKGQEGDFTWTKRYKGCDLKELDLPGLLKEAGVKYKRMGSQEDIDQYILPCPWINQHTTQNAERDAMVHMFEPRGSYWPAFNCLHSHCQNRGLKDLLGWLEESHGITLGIIRRHCGNKRPRIEVEDDSIDLIEPPILPDPIIDSLLFPELKMLIASASKLGKTWLGMTLGFSLAGGLPWLGFDTCQSKVLYLNLEMAKQFFKRRVYDIKRVQGITGLPKGSFQTAYMRGMRMAEDSKDQISLLYETLILIFEQHGPFDVIIYDPIYKLLGDLDENKATDVAKFLNMIDEVGQTTKAANVLIHHFAKGDALMKRAGDRASGSGVFLRDPDTYIAITELGEEESGQARVDFRLRCAPRILPFGIRRDNFTWKRDPTIDISKKNKNEPKESKPKQLTVADKMLQILKDAPQGLTNVAWKNEVVARQITSAGNFDNTLTDLRRAGLIKQMGRLYFAA